MGISMKNFEMPKKLVLDESNATPTYGRFVAEPFDRGYGMTVGNGLRRVLISSIEGTSSALLSAPICEEPSGLYQTSRITSDELFKFIRRGNARRD